MSKNGIDKLIKGISNISNESEWNKIQKKVDNVYMQDKSSEEVSLSYMEFLYESTKINTILSNIVHKIVNKGEEIFEQNSNSKNILKIYFRILFSLLRKKEDISKIAKYKIETMVEDNVLSEEDVVYIFNWIFDSESVFKKINEEKLSKIVDLMRNQYERSEEVEVSYLRLYTRMSLEVIDEEQVLDMLEKEFVRFTENKKSDKVAITYLDILPNFFIIKRTNSQINDLLEKGEKVYEGFKSSEDVAASYLNFLSKFFSVDNTDSQINELLEKGEKVYEGFKSSEKVVVSYLKFLYRAPVNNSSISLFKNIEKRIKKEHRNSSIIYLVYLQCLLKMSSKELKLETLEIIEKEADKYSSNSVNNRELKEISIEYVKTLALISFYKNDFKDIQTIVDKIEKYIDVDSSDEMKTTYIRLLMRLSEMEPAKEKRKETAEKVKNLIPDEINGNNFFMSLFYLAILRNLSVKQNEKNELKATLDEAEKVETSLSSFLPNNWPDFIQIVLNYALSLDDLKTKKYVDDILSRENISRETIEKIYDRLIETKTDTVEQREKFSILIKKLFKKFYKDNSSQSTEKGEDDNSQSKKEDQYYSSQSIKYSVLYELTENMSEKNKDILIDIFILVQQVKYQLIVKKPKKLEFGHYTSGKVLQIFLNQKDDEEKNSNANPKDDSKDDSKNDPNAIPYAIKKKSRLYNVNNMNDPSEGKVLDQYLQLGTTSEQLSLRPRPWFLMCLTTSIDNLTMWAQYGEKAEGVCLVFKSGDFSEVSSLADIEWFTMNKNPFDIFSSVSLNNTEHKDFIYRIGYLSIQKNNSMRLDRNFNAGLCKEEVKKINESLKTMKNTINTINKNSELFEKVDKFLEEIRYLFKSADYSYESELRLLKYSPLDSDNKKIKIDDTGDIAKLYIERDNPIQISEVIFGPKYSHPENVTPLLHLLDKNIKFSQSKIQFK